MKKKKITRDDIIGAVLIVLCIIGICVIALAMFLF